MIQFKNMGFSYSGSSKKVFDGFNLTIGEGTICGLLGMNGTGKSTLLNLMSGLLCPKAGSVTIDNDKVFNRNAETLGKFFYVQDELTLPNIKVKTYADLLRPFYPNFSDEVLRKCLDEFGIDSSSKLQKMSLGEKKKAVISIAMAAGTKILLMDEPTNGLDIPSKVTFRKIIAEGMDEGRTMVISTHLVHDVEQMLDRVVVINKEGLLMDKSLAELTNEFIFEVSAAGSASSDTLYSEQTVGGEAIIRPRKDGEEETNVNIELLFNYLNNKKD